jgi:ubiquinone/menaquinone biosynthesis C-methylase UbiE
MNLRLKFNEDALNYDKFRPTYAADLFRDVISFSGITQNSDVLEIGIGTGQATLPFLQTGCNLTAIELGNQLTEYSRNKFTAYEKIKILNADFTEYNEDENTYDLIYSATAFHWIPQETGFPKIMRLLKNNATIALFWNHPFVNRHDDEIHVAVQKIYDKYRPSDKPKAEFSERDCQKYSKLLEQYGFTNITSKLYKQTRQLNADEYISLLNTYSDHRALDQNIKESFETEIKKAINASNGIIKIYDTMDLYLAKKK